MKPNSYNRGSNIKYLTFKPDAGAFNNKRVAFESLVLFALVTGRTLVLPPDKYFSFGDYYSMEDLSRVVHFLPAKEFFKRKELETSFLSTDSACGICGRIKKKLARAGGGLDKTEYLEAIKRMPDTHVTKWIPCEGDDTLFFPRDDSPTCDSSCLRDASKHRRSKHIEYDEVMQKASVFHWDEPRILVAFAAMIAFQDPAEERLAHLTMRNHVHLNGYLFDMAAKVVHEILQKAGKYHAMHVRRGDFQYKQSKFKGVEAVYMNVQHLFEEGDTIYIATDEKDRSYFDPLRKHYKLLFFSDFPEVMCFIGL